MSVPLSAVLSRPAALSNVRRPNPASKTFDETGSGSWNTNLSPSWPMMSNECSSGGLPMRTGLAVAFDVVAPVAVRPGEGRGGRRWIDGGGHRAGGRGPDDA